MEAFRQKGAGGDKTFPVDKWAEDIIIASLERVHSEGETFTLISEELGTRAFGGGRQIVLVDPIDGSNNAKRVAFPFFPLPLPSWKGISFLISLLHTLLILEWAMRSGQCGEKVHIKTGDGSRHRRVMSLTIVAYEASTPARDVPRIMPIINSAKRIRCFGSTALDLAYLASGAISAFATATVSRTFDYAAGMLIVQEAGGVMTDLAGNALDDVIVGLDRTAPLLAAANRKLHAAVLELFKH